jgi:hypothetical protein
MAGIEDVDPQWEVEGPTNEAAGGRLRGNLREDNDSRVEGWDDRVDAPEGPGCVQAVGCVAW